MDVRTAAEKLISIRASAMRPADGTVDREETPSRRGVQRSPTTDPSGTGARRVGEEARRNDKDNTI